MHINRHLLGWGAFFILVGAVPLALRAGIVDRSVVEQWPTLWPLLLVGWGIGLVLRRMPGDWVGGVITTVTFGVMGGGLIATGLGGIPVVNGCGDTAGATSFPAKSGSLATSKNLSVELPCGRLEIRTGSGSDWAVSGRDRDGTGPRILETADRVTIDAKDDPSDIFGSRYEWLVKVPTDPTLGLSTTVNAGEGIIDLTGAHLAGVSFTLNAGTIRVNAADAAELASLSGTVNAGTGSIGLPNRSISTSLTLNAGSLDVCVPRDAGLRIHVSTTLASHNVGSLGLVKTGDSSWTTANVAGAATVVDLSVTANAGSFNLIIGGSCGA